LKKTVKRLQGVAENPKGDTSGSNISNDVFPEYVNGISPRVSEVSSCTSSSTSSDFDMDRRRQKRSFRSLQNSPRNNSSASGRHTGSPRSLHRSQSSNGNGQTVGNTRNLHRSQSSSIRTKDSSSKNGNSRIVTKDSFSENSRRVTKDSSSKNENSRRVETVDLSKLINNVAMLSNRRVGVRA